MYWPTGSFQIPFNGHWKNRWPLLPDHQLIHSGLLVITAIKVEQRPLFLIVSFLSPRAWSAVRGFDIEVLCGWRGQHEEWEVWGKIPLQLKPSAICIALHIFWGEKQYVLNVFSPSLDTFLTMVQSTHYWLNQAADSDDVVWAGSETIGQEIFRL